LLYDKGVFTENSTCQCAVQDTDGDPLVTHAVTLVGYSLNNLTAGCAGYWIAHNSWGTSWGEKGFLRMCIPLNTKEETSGTCNSQYLTMFADIGLIPKV